MVLLATASLPFLPASVVRAEELAAIKDPAKLGFEPAKLSLIDRQMKELIAEQKVIGCAALIYKDGQIAYSKIWGQRNKKEELPVEADTIWRIYSMSKPVTSVAVMQLVERGKIGLDDPASKYLPEFKGLEVYDEDGKAAKKGALPTSPAKREMTIRDLLRHTSGLSYGFFGNTPVDLAYRKAGILVLDKDLKDMTSKLAKVPLLHQPGTRFHYSASTDVLGRVVEVASEMTFKDYLDKNIFQPLKMKDTYFSLPKEKLPRLAEMYRPEDGKLVPANRLSSARFVNEKNTFYSGGGGLCSTTADYLQFSKMLLNGGELNGKRILKSETIEQMTTNQLPKNAAWGRFQFGLGFQIDAEGHYSWGGAAGTRFWVDPKNKMITIFMIQINPYRAKYGQVFKRLAYNALESE